MWSAKYKPTRIEEMVGNEDARIEFMQWLLSWKVGIKPLLLIGPPGTGKTTLVKIASNQFNIDLIELNASDTRSKERLESIITPLVNNLNLLSKKVILFLDEVDGIDENTERGALTFLLSLAKSSNMQMVMAANKENNNIIKELSKVCKVIRFKEITPRLMQLYINQLLTQLNVDIDIGTKINIIRSSNGDMRNVLNAINAKILLESKGDEHIEGNIEISVAINRFFNAESIDDAIIALRSSEGSYYDQRFIYNNEMRRLDKLHAIFSSIVNSEIDVNNLADALNVLSYIDILIGRMNSIREWRLLRYIDIILATMLFGKSRGLLYQQYDLPFLVTNKILKYRDSINKLVSRLSKILNISKNEVSLYYIPYLLLIIKGNVNKFLEANNIDQSIASNIEEIINSGELNDNITKK
jgi:replication factor C large subunit